MSTAKSNILYLVFLTTLPSSTLLQYGYSQTTAPTPALANQISVLSSSSFRDDTGAYHIVGEVKNNSPIDSMKYVKIVATLYDKTRKAFGTDFTFSDVDVLRPTEKSSFKIILTDIRQSQKITVISKMIKSAAFYNSSNVVVAADLTYTDPKDLGPRQTAPFEIVVTSVPIISNEITSASLNVNSEQYSSIAQNQTIR
jgi:hypothetical protein